MDAEAEQSLRQHDPVLEQLFFPATGRSLQGFVDSDRMLADMDRAHIDRVVIQGEYRRSHDACVARNDVAIQLVHRHPDRFAAFAMIQPLAGQAALDELSRCLDAGLVGVGELGSYAQGFALDDPHFLRLVEACIAAGVPLNMHTNEEVGHVYAGKGSTPLRDFFWLATEYPDLKLILAHWGGGLLFYEIVPSIKRALHNVWYDTAASPLIFPTPAIFAMAMQSAGPAKFLFGSDYPLLLFPGRTREPDFCAFLDQIDALGLEPEAADAIMGGNVARLLGWMSPEPTPDAQQPHSVQAHHPEKIGPGTSVRYAAHRWPATQAVFDAHGIPWQDSPVPFWEPVCQAAAARGLNRGAQNALLDELNEAIS